jgi:hypothetical protein
MATTSMASTTAETWAALDQQGQYYLGHLSAADTFYHDPDHPSYLILPVVPPARPAPSAR